MKTIAAYAYQTELDGDLPSARERVVAALQEQGFGVLTEVDVQTTLKDKLGIDWPPYRILGVCNPKIAHEALQESLHVGLMLPCTVTLREEGGRTVVEALRPEAALGILGLEDIRPSAAEAERRLVAVIDALEGVKER